jgi:hypothetical protein
MTLSNQRRVGGNAHGQGTPLVVVVVALVIVTAHLANFGARPLA